MKEDDYNRPLIIREDGRPPLSPYTKEETKIWFAKYRPDVTLIDLDQIMAERKARYRERMDVVFGRRSVDQSEGTNAQAGDPLVEMPEVVPATESSTTLAASTAVDPLAAEEGLVAKLPHEDTGLSSEENVVTNSSLAQNAEKGPVPKRRRKDLGPSSEANVILSSHNGDSGNN